jgi:hypothetical protein
MVGPSIFCFLGFDLALVPARPPAQRCLKRRTGRCLEGSVAVAKDWYFRLYPGILLVVAGIGAAAAVVLLLKP